MELLQEPVQIRVLVVVVEKTMKEVDIGVLLSQLIAAVLAVARKKSAGIPFKDYRIPPGRSAILQLLRLVDIDSETTCELECGLQLFIELSTCEAT